MHGGVLDNVVIMLTEKNGDDSCSNATCIKGKSNNSQSRVCSCYFLGVWSHCTLNPTQQICACIGSRIDLYILGLLVRKHILLKVLILKKTIFFAKTAISVASWEGLLAVTHNVKGVTFIHDSINEAAYSLLKPVQRAPYHLKLGQILHKNLCPRLFQKCLFTVAAQLVRGNELTVDAEGNWIATASIFLSAEGKSMAVYAYPEARFSLQRAFICCAKTIG